MLSAVVMTKLHAGGKFDSRAIPRCRVVCMASAWYASALSERASLRLARGIYLAAGVRLRYSKGPLKKTGKAGKEDRDKGCNFKAEPHHHGCDSLQLQNARWRSGC